MSRLQHFGPYLAAVAVGFAFLLLVASSLYSFHHRQTVDHDICEAIVSNRDADRAQWESVQKYFPPEVISAALRPIPVLQCVDNKPVPKEGG